MADELNELIQRIDRWPPQARDRALYALCAFENEYICGNGEL